jgi:hypothetical protein
MGAGAWRAWYKAAMSQQQREHSKRYLSSFKKWKEKNLPERQCHRLAATVAREEFPLSNEE